MNMNRKLVLLQLEQAKQELDDLLRRLDRDENRAYPEASGEPKLQAGLDRINHYLNLAWSIRHLSSEEYAKQIREQSKE